MVKKQKKQINAELPEATLDAVRRSASKLAKPHGLEIHDVRFGPTDFGLTLSVVNVSNWISQLCKRFIS